MGFKLYEASEKNKFFLYSFIYSVAKWLWQNYLQDF